MRISSIKVFSLSILVFAFCSGFKPRANNSVCGSVSMGDPTQEICVGKGVCHNSPGGTASANGDGITVRFFVLESDPNILVMTFSLSDLKASQPDQVAYFTDPSGSYNFDSPYSLTDNMFAPLNLLPNAMILPSSNSVVQIDGDMVIDYITYSHD